MLLSSRKTLAAVLIAGLSIAGTAAIAQQAAAPAGPDKHGPWGGHHHMLPEQMIEARLAYIKTALQITPAQTTQWNAVADVMRKQAKARDEMITAMRAKMDADKGDESKRPDVVERLEHRQKMLATASANTAELIAAVKPLYASLSDSQKEIAGQVLGGHDGHHGGWGHGGGR